MTSTGKHLRQKTISGYTSWMFCACTCVYVGWLRLMYVCIYIHNILTTHHLYESIHIFHYLIETNAEVIFSCAVSLCLDADYLRRFNWPRDTIDAREEHLISRLHTDHAGQLRQGLRGFPKPITILKPNSSADWKHGAILNTCLLC